MINLSFNEKDLPEVIVDEDISGDYTYVKVGDWSFCVEDDMEYERWWEDAKSLIVYARYLDTVKKEKEQKK